MRVLHLGKFFPPHAGGIERFTAVLLKALAGLGVQQAALVHATPGKPRPSRDWTDTDSGARLREVPCHGRLLFAPVSPGWPQACRRLIREFRPDLLHLHLPNPSAFWLLAMPEARRLPWVLHWHADVPSDARHLGVRLAARPYRLLERRLLERAGMVIATSDAYRDGSSELARFRDKVRVVGLAVEEPEEADATAAPGWPGPGLRVLAVGRLSYYKGFEVLLRALAQVPDASLLIVGDGERRQPLEAELRRLGLADRVRLTGELPDPVLHAAYRACDLFCLPSLDRSEAFGLVLLEAMRAGKPVLASRVPGSGVVEVAADGETAVLVPPGDADALALALRALASDPDRRARLGAAGLERWQRQYRPGPVAAQVLALYEDVIAGGPVFRSAPPPTAVPGTRPPPAPPAAPGD